MSGINLDETASLGLVYLKLGHSWTPLAKTCGFRLICTRLRQPWTHLHKTDQSKTTKYCPEIV